MHPHENTSAHSPVHRLLGTPHWHRELALRALLDDDFAPYGLADLGALHVTLGPPLALEIAFNAAGSAACVLRYHSKTNNCLLAFSPPDFIALWDHAPWAHRALRSVLPAPLVLYSALTRARLRNVAGDTVHSRNTRFYRTTTA